MLDGLRRVLLILGLVLTASPAIPQPRDVSVPEVRGEKRTALVIGNAEYSNGRLRNPVNDARAMADALRAVGFNVEMYENVTQKQMYRAIKAFGAQIQGDGVGLFYYAGHGMQVRGRNYLIPIDAEIHSESDVEIESVEVGSLLAQMEPGKNRLNVVVLDACRDNPFARQFRSLAGGLASIDAPAGTLIAYATAPGRVALDGSGPNSVYTSELAKTIRLPGLRIEDVFKRVRQAVRAETRDEQVPWESSSLVGDFMFVSPSAVTGKRDSLGARPLQQNLTALTTEVNRKTQQSLAAAEKGRYEEAERLALEAVSDAEGFGAQDVRLAYALSVLAQAQLRQARYTDADATTERAMSIIEKVKHPTAAFALSHLGLAYLRANQPVRSEGFLKRAIQMTESQYGPEHPFTGGMLALLAVAYLNKFEDVQAEPILARALTLAEVSLGRREPWESPEKSVRAAGDLVLASDLSYAGATYLDRGAYTKADELFRRSVPLLKKALGPDNLQVAMNLEWHAKALKMLNRTAEATAMGAEAQSIRARLSKP